MSSNCFINVYIIIITIIIIIYPLFVRVVEAPQMTSQPVSSIVLCFKGFYITIIIYSLTAKVIGTPQMISQPVFSIFPVLHCPLGPAEHQACPFPDVVFPPLPLSDVSSSSLACSSGMGWEVHSLISSKQQRADITIQTI